MRHSRHTIVTVGCTVGVATLVLVAAGWVLSDCAVAGEQVFPVQLESRIAKGRTADDHLAAALLYQSEAQGAQAEANKYTQAAAAIGPLEDPKGFRRSGLMTAAQTNQKYAGEMQQLYVPFSVHDSSDGGSVVLGAW